MSVLKKIFIGIVVIVLIIILLAIITINNYKHKGLPEYAGVYTLRGISGEVTVYRDKFAIPHIVAENEKDLYTATGYITAQDRLWQMDLLRRVTQGKLSEIFGDNYVDTDLLMRMLRFSEKSNTIIKNLSDNELEMLTAFTNGVNQYINENIDNLPLEFNLLRYKPEEWKPEHTINLLGYMSWELKMSWGIELALQNIKNKLGVEKYKEFLPDLSYHITTLYPDYQIDTATSIVLGKYIESMKKIEDLGIQIFSGSNNWAVSGKKTLSGKPLLANDMHLDFKSRGLWYQIHQKVPGKLNVTGLLIPGEPLVVCGHNDSIAWGMTNVMLNDIDFYKETVNDDSSKYLINGEWKNFSTKNENILIKGGQEKSFIVKFTHRGPVISGLKKYEDVISIKWIGNEYSNELRGIYLFNRAKNWNDFKIAGREFKSISQNINYADTKGNIGLYCCAGVPLRRGNAIAVATGDTSAFDWKGFIPFEELPNTYNPKCGYVVSANNKLTSDDYPYYVSHWYDLPWRYDRIKYGLEKKDFLSVEDFQKIQNDKESSIITQLKPVVTEALYSSDELTETESKCLSHLDEWEGDYDVSSTGAIIFESFLVDFIHEIVYDELGSDLYKEFINEKILVRNLIVNALNNPSLTLFDDITTNDTESREKIIRNAFSISVQKLSEIFGSDVNTWKWGALHTLTLKHPLSKVNLFEKLFKLNRGPFQVPGSFSTISPFSYNLNQPFEVIHGPSHRQIYVVGDWDNSISVIPTGISGIPSSPHYSDQTELYLNGNYHQDLFDLQLIKENARYTTTFIPE